MYSIHVYLIFHSYSRIKKQQYYDTEGAIKMENSEKLSIYDEQDQEKQNKNTTQNVLDATIRKQIQIT